MVTAAKRWCSMDHGAISDTQDISESDTDAHSRTQSIPAGPWDPNSYPDMYTMVEDKTCEIIEEKIMRWPIEEWV